MNQTSEEKPEFDLEKTMRGVVDAALDRKAVDLKVLQLGKVTDFTEYFVIASGTNERQVQALSDGIGRQCRSIGVRPLHIEGYREGRWVLMDYGDFVAHLFLEEAREYYGLEDLWSDAPDVTPGLSSKPAEESHRSEPEGASPGTPASELSQES